MKVTNAEYAKNGKATVKKPPHLECLYIPPDHELGKVWDFVRLGIEDLLGKVRPKGFLTLRPEDVYVRVRGNMASLYLVKMDGFPVGWGIIQKQNDLWLNSDPFLLSWLGWCDKREAVEFYFRELEKIALAMKLKEIRHESTRHGWILSPPGPGWEVLTSKGWEKDYEPKSMYRALAMAPSITMRKVVMT